VEVAMPVGGSRPTDYRGRSRRARSSQQCPVIGFLHPQSPEGYVAENLGVWDKR
jgi:hypothetical protein